MLPRNFSALALMLVGAAITFAFWPALVGMKSMWDNTPMYSFGYIVPLVSALLIWSRRRQLSAIEPRPAIMTGGAAALAAVVLLIVGRVSGVLIAEQLGFVVALVAAVLLVAGAAALRLIWVALAYLLLMVPFWDAFTEPLHLPFQQLSATLGIEMLHLVGIPAYREGVMLYLPNITLEVARACSGVNYLVAILALGVPLGYLYLPTFGRRLVLVSLAVVVAALSNSLRVALIGILAYFDVGSPLHGPFHVLHGLFVSGIGYVVLLVGLHWLRGSAAPDAPAAAGAVASRGGGSLAPRLVPAIVLAVAFVAAPLYAASLRPEPVPAALPLAALADPLGPWTADFLGVPAGQWWQGADDELRRRYRRPGSAPVDVHIGYFRVQHQGKEIASHLSAPLHRAGSAAQSAGGMPGAPNAILLKDGGREHVGFFWYQIDGDVVRSPYAAKARTLWNVIAHGRSNGAMVVILAPVEGPEERQAQLDATRDLAARVHRALQPLVEPGLSSSAR
jgi:EpsI family protein